MNEINLYRTLTLPLPDGSTIELLPPSRNSKTFRPLLVELQSIWVQCDFDVYRTVTHDRAWELMQEIINLLPLKDSPAERGIDLNKKYSNQYGLLRWLFLQQDEVAPVADGVTSFTGAAVLELCEIRPLSVLLEAIALANPEPSPGPTPVGATDTHA